MAEEHNVLNVNEIAEQIGKKVAESVPSAESIGQSVADNNQTASKSDRVTEIEGEREAAKERAGLRGIFEDIRDSWGGSWATFKERDKKGGGLLAGLLGGISGSGIGGLGKGIASLGKGLAVGLASLGAGIAGFMLAIGGVGHWLGAAANIPIAGVGGGGTVGPIHAFFDGIVGSTMAKQLFNTKGDIDPKIFNEQYVNIATSIINTFKLNNPNYLKYIEEQDLYMGIDI